MSQENKVVDAEITNQNQVQKPNPEQAVGILRQASRQYRGTRDEHDMIDNAIEVLQELVKSK